MVKKPSCYKPRNKSKIVYGAYLTAAAIVTFPLSIHRVDHRSGFARGLAISAHKASPAYAAFEDLHQNYNGETTFPEGRSLNTERTFEYKPSPTSVHQLAMHGITIHGSAEPKAFYVAGEVRSRPVALVDRNGGLLPMAVRKRLILDRLGDEDLRSPSVAGIAAELVKKELQAPVTKTYRTASGSTITIARAAESPESPSAHEATKPPVPPSDDGMAIIKPASSEMRPLWLVGQVEMTGGLAFVPDTQVVLQRMFNGEAFEHGRIWVTEGKFEIHIKKPLGSLLAELQTKDGRVLGRGEVNLFDLMVDKKSDRVTDVRIALRPTAEGALFHTVSGDSYAEHKIPVTDAHVEIQAFSEAQKVNHEGGIAEPTLSRDSTFVARALARNSWPTLVVGQAHDPQDIRLYSNAKVRALLNLGGVDKKEGSQHGIIWGVVTQNGKPLAAAQVEVAGDYHPLYFNEGYIPDARLNQTSSNGLFAIANVKAGVQAIRVRIAGKVYPAQVFPTEDKHVSYLELEVRGKVITQFKVFDGLQMRPISAQIRLIGNEEALTVGANDFVEFSTAADPFMVEADGGAEYELSRVTVSGPPHVVHVPLIPRQWLAQLAAEKSINLAPDRGTIVGFMDHAYDIELTGYAPGQQMQIIYFDSNGRQKTASNPGGGFAIFNAPRGLQTVYLHPMQSRETFSQIVVAEPEFVHVITH